MSVGEINENKNHRAIIEAMHLLDDGDIKYFIAGQGELREELQKLVERYGLGGQVSFLGYRADIPDLLKAADIFCFPSKREGLGLAAIEAMACGLPLLTSNVHGINDYSVDGVTGYAYSPNDYEGFSKGLACMKNHKERMYAFGRGNALTAGNYAVEEADRRMREIYSRYKPAAER